MPCKPNFQVRVDGNGRRRYWIDGQEIDSEADYIAKHVDRFGVPPEIDPPKEAR